LGNRALLFEGEHALDPSGDGHRDGHDELMSLGHIGISEEPSKNIGHTVGRILHPARRQNGQR
jgi:hypothetical protein